MSDDVSKILATNNIDPILKTLLKRAILNKNNSPSTLATLQNFPIDKYELLLNEQTNIGWDKIHQGRMGLSWDRYQRRYQTMIGEIISYTKPAWIQQTIHSILAVHHMLWTSRCDVLHSDSTEVQCRRELMTQQLEGLYAYESQMLIQYRDCFKRTLEEWKEKSTFEIQS